MLKTLRRSRGFTLIEVMVVIVILGVLAALVVPKVMSRPDEARAVPVLLVVPTHELRHPAARMQQT